MVLMVLAVISLVLGWSFKQMMQKWDRWFGAGGLRNPVGTIAGRTVRAGELGEFYSGLKMAGQASQWWAMALNPRDASPEDRRRLYAYTMGMTAWPILSQTMKSERADRDTILAWLALYEEARRLGFGTSAAQVNARIESLRPLGLTGLHLARVVDDVAGGRQGLLFEGLRKDMTLVAYINWLGETLGAAVEPEMRREFTRMDERIKVRLVALNAEDAVEQVKDVADETLRKQFGKYRKFLAGKGPEGYGYRIPDRVAIEYLVADPAGFEKEAAPEVTAKAVRAYYDANKDTEFLVKQEKDEKPDADKKNDAKAADGNDQPASADEQHQKPPEKKVRPFDEVRDQIRKTLVRRHAERLARRRLHENVAEIRTMRKKPKLGIWADGTAVRHVRAENLHTAEALAELEGIGQATCQTDAFPAYAVAVVELVGQDKARIAVGEISDVFTGTDGRAYAFRVTDVQANHEPADLNEVRDKVLADVRRAKAFEMIRERGKKLIEAASAKKSLEDAAKDASLETVVSDWFPRERAIPYGGRWITLPSALPKVGSNRLVVEECFRMAEDGRQRILVTLAGRQMVVAAELIERKPPREAAFDAMRPLIAQRVASRLAGSALRDVLASGAIQRRMIVVPEVVDDSPRPSETGDETGR